jgi:hypothetical protein
LNSQVGVGCQPLDLEAPHLTAGSCRTIEPFTADDGPHGLVAGESLGVVHVFVASQPTEHRLAKQPAQCVACVLATSAVQEFRDRDLGEPQDVVELTVGEQPAVGGDPGTVRDTTGLPLGCHTSGVDAIGHLTAGSRTRYARGQK